MPSIDVAMVRSLRGGVTGILARSLEQAFVRRSIISDAESNITDVKTAFSSWDNCMAAVYCKYVHLLFPFLFFSHVSLRTADSPQMARDRCHHHRRSNHLLRDLVHSPMSLLRSLLLLRVLLLPEMLRPMLWML